MEIDLSELSESEKFDHCIVGAGPAGITLALKLSSAGKRVLFLEGGGKEIWDQSQDLYKGKSIGDTYVDLDIARLRYFGGTSNHWGGYCRELDEEDFHVKGHIKSTGWPIEKNDLRPYLHEAKKTLEISSIPNDVFMKKHGLKNIGFVYSTIRFREKYFDKIKNDKNVFLVLNANVTSFDVEESYVRQVSVQDYKGVIKKYQSKIFILSTGGIENSRLLLWSDLLANGKLLKNNANIGRYWMEHPVFTLGNALITTDFPFKFDNNGLIYFSPTKEMMDRYNILNCGLRMQQTHHKGTKRIIANLLCVAPELGKWAMGLFDKQLICGTLLRAAWEQEPRAENRIELSDQKDALGMPRVNLFWRKSETDLRTVRVSAELLGKYLASDRVGRLRLDDWVYGKADYPEDDELIGYHHMGGTRMADSAKTGVVDNNCRLFGQENFYIVGSSVFPSAGHANPTLTIVQLALRLGDHLINKT